MKNKILSFLLVALAGSTYAQSTEPAVVAEPNAATEILVEQVAQDEEAVDTLEDYQVTAYRFPTSQLDTPVNTTVITSKDIAESFSTNIADVLQKKANVQLYNIGSTALSKVSMRGYGDASSNVLVIIDGQRMNRADMGNINWQQIPLEYIESIEVMRGSQSAMYGNNATAGVIKITTKKGTQDDVYSINLQGGSNEYYSVNGLITGSVDNWYYSASVGRIEDGGYQDNSASWTNTYNLSASLDISEAVKLSVTANFAESSFEIPSSMYWSAWESDPTTSYWDENNYEYREGVYTLALNTNTSFGEGEVALSGSFRDTTFDMLEGSNSNYTVNEEWHLYFTPKYKFNISDDASVIVGFDAEYVHIDSDYTSGWSSDWESYDDISEIQRYSFAPYVAGDITLAEKFILSAALRYEYATTQVDCTGYNNYDESLDSEGLAANIGLTYKVNENSSLYFRFDQIYRYPTTEEIASYNGYSDYATSFNSNLKPENGQNYEIGYKYMDRNWTVSLNGFLQYLEDEIYYNASAVYVDAYGGYYLGLNENYKDPTLRYGIDYQLSYDDKYWGASIMGTVQQSQFVGGEYDGNRIPLVANFTNTVSVYVKPIERLRIALSLSYVDSSPFSGDLANEYSEMPSYFLLDLIVHFKITEYATLYFGVDNLLDEQYMSYGYINSYSYSADTDYEIYSGIGRTFRVGVNLTF